MSGLCLFVSFAVTRICKMASQCSYFGWVGFMAEIIKAIEELLSEHWIKVLTAAGFTLIGWLAGGTLASEPSLATPRVF